MYRCAGFWKNLKFQVLLSEGYHPILPVLPFDRISGENLGRTPYHAEHNQTFKQAPADSLRINQLSRWFYHLNGIQQKNQRKKIIPGL